MLSHKHRIMYILIVGFRAGEQAGGDAFRLGMQNEETARYYLSFYAENRNAVIMPM